MERVENIVANNYLSSEFCGKLWNVSVITENFNI